MNRTEKQQTVDLYRNAFLNSELFIVGHYRGSTVAQMTEMRDKSREAGVFVKVTKNSLAKIALQGTQFEQVADLFTGPTLIASSQDPVAAAKIMADFAESNDNLKIVGGALGQSVLDVDGIMALAKLPSLDELRAKLLALISTPAQRLATIMQAPAAQLARVTKAYSEKN